MTLLKTYCIILGEDYDTIKNDTPQSKKKVATMATCILIPTVVWFITAFLTVSMVMQLPTLTAWGAGVVVAFLIFQLERSIIMANGNWLLAAFRLVLGGLMASLGSIVLDQVLFKEDIEHQLTTNRATHVQTELNKVKKQHEQALAEQKQNVDRKYQLWLDNQTLVHKEMAGVGLSRKRGPGFVTKQLLANEEKAKSEYDKAQAELVRMNGEQSTDLAKKTLETERSYSSKSLLLRIKAMFDLVKTDPNMSLVYWLVTGLLFMLEFIAILLKMTHSKSNYDLKIEQIDEIGKARINILAGKTNSDSLPQTKGVHLPYWALAVILVVLGASAFLITHEKSGSAETGKEPVKNIVLTRE
jgi:hypothetical protein